MSSGCLCATADPTGEPSTGPARFGIVRAAVAVVLLTAAALKAHQLATRPVLATDVLSSRWVLTLQVELEILLGFWLLSGFRQRLAWLAGLVCFTVFSCVTLHKGIRGDATCGCFGVVPVDPWYTLVLDVAIVAALLAFPPAKVATVPARAGWLRLTATLVLALAAGAVAAVTAATYRPARIATDGGIIGDQRWVELTPREWVAKPLPILGHIDVGPELAQGQWTVVLYHHDCPYCREAIPEYDRLASVVDGQKDAGRVALIEMPPYGPRDHCPIAADTRCLLGRLSDARNWFAATPVEIVLDDGQVRRVRERLPVAQIRAIDRGKEPWLDAPRVGVWGPSWQAAHDFGFLKPSSRQRLVFVVNNRSDEAIQLKVPRSECPCMQVVDWPQAVAGRSSGQVQVLFVAPKKATAYSKRILINTAGPKGHKIVLRVAANVGQPLEVRPAKLALGRFAAGQDRRAELMLINHGGKPVRPIYSTSSGVGCVAQIPLASVPPGGHLAIPVLIQADRASPGANRQTVQIHTDCSDQPRVSVTVSYVVATTPAPTGPERKAG